MATDTASSGLSNGGHTPLRAVAAVVALTASAARPSLLRRWSRKAVQSTPPPLPLISLPPDDEWEEFDVPAKTGFGYVLPDVGLHDEETSDDSSANGLHGAAPPRLHDRSAICRMLSEYMTQNEVFQVKRHGFGIDTKLIYKRNKSNVRGRSTSTPPTEPPSDEELAFNAFFESGNLDRAYRVLGRQYATTQELLGNPSSHANTSAASTGVAPWSSPFPFFAKADMEYDLFCDTDVSTHGHIQWYFFRATVPIGCFKRAAATASASSSSATTTTLRVRINIRNMLKKASLYNDGMLPAVYVDGKHGRGWHHAGTNLCYFKNADTYRNRKSGKVSNYYTLSFVYDFQLPSDAATNSLCVYFAHCYPYTYTRLQQHLTQLQKDPERNRFFRRRVLCKTIAGNICDVLTISDFSQEDDARSGVILTARVHPGESNASFIMHGIIDFLTGPSLEARYLRHRFVFKIVPMLNPDGVIHGNYRCSLAGTDLNRRYMDPSPELHPTVYATKNMVLSMRKTRVVSLYCDIHGHSRKKNLFLYGCLPYEEYSRSEAAKLRVFPHVLCKICCATSNPGASGGTGCYSFPDCTFSVSKSKKGTGRVVVWDEAQVLNSFTLEASFFGVGVNKTSKRAVGVTAAPETSSNQQQRRAGEGNNQTTAAIGDLAMTHFMPNDLRTAGAKFCLSLIPFAHLMDRDRPPAQPQAVVAPVNSEGGAGFSPPALFSSPSPVRCSSVGSAASWRPQTTLGTPVRHLPNDITPSPREDEASSPIYDSKLRLAPLSNAPQTSSTPFLLPRSPSNKSVLPSSPTSSLAVEFPTSFDSLFSMDGLFASMASPEGLLKEIEDTLPENYSHCGDSDDEAESAGSESDPSGDNMEEEELQRQDAWKTLVPDVSDTILISPPKLTKNRSETLLKRFSDSMLRIAQLAEEFQATTPPPEPTVVQPEPKKGIAPILLRKSLKATPAAVLDPVKTQVVAPAHVMRRPSGHLVPAHEAARDRNRDIASLHLRAVQRRTRTKRAGRQMPTNEQDLQ